MASFVSTITYRPGRSEESCFWHCLSTEPLVYRFFRRGIIARHAPRRRKRGVVNNFRGRETQIYQLSRLSDLETWHLCLRPIVSVVLRSSLSSPDLQSDQGTRLAQATAIINKLVVSSSFPADQSSEKQR